MKAAKQDLEQEVAIGNRSAKSVWSPHSNFNRRGLCAATALAGPYAVRVSVSTRWAPQERTSHKAT